MSTVLTVIVVVVVLYLLIGLSFVTRLIQEDAAMGINPDDRDVRGLLIVLFAWPYIWLFWKGRK